MQTRAHSPRPSIATTISLGAFMSAGIWLAAGPDLAFAGFAMAAAIREAGDIRRCGVPSSRWSGAR